MSLAKTVLIHTEMLSLDTMAHQLVFPQHNRLLHNKFMYANKRLTCEATISDFTFTSFSRKCRIRKSVIRLGEVDVSGAITQALVDKHNFAFCSRRVPMVVDRHAAHTRESRQEGDVCNNIWQGNQPAGVTRRNDRISDNINHHLLDCVMVEQCCCHNVV